MTSADLLGNASCRMGISDKNVNSKEKNLSLETKSFWANEEISHKKTKVHCLVSQSPPLVLFLRYMNPLNILSSCFCSIHFNIIALSTTKSSPFSCRIETSHEPISYSCYMPRLSHPRSFDNPGRENKLWNSSLNIYLWLYSPLLGLSRFFIFLIFYTVGRTPWTGISPSQGLYLFTEQHKHSINANRYHCLK
jgi:hypothetical protein